MTNEVQLDGIGLTQMIRPVPPFDTSTPPSDGQALVWDSTAGKYRPGSGGSLPVLDLRDFAAGVGVGNSTADTAALEAAWAYMTASATSGVVASSPSDQYDISHSTLILPPGSITYTGTGLTDAGITGFAGRFAIRGAHSGTSEIRLSNASGRLIDIVSSTITRFDLADFQLRGGLGLFRHQRTSDNIFGDLAFRRLVLRSYTGCAIEWRSQNMPYVTVEGCTFRAADTLNTMGIALAGIANGSQILRNRFLLNRVHVKMQNGGCDVYLDGNDFLRFSTDRTNGPCTDLWLVPTATFVPAFGTGTGTHLTRSNKMGNENFQSGDFKVLVADEDTGSGSSNGTRWPDTTNASAGFLEGVTIAGTMYGAATALRSPIYSTTPNLYGLDVNIMHRGTSSLPDYIIELSSAALTAAAATYDVLRATNRVSLAGYGAGLSLKVVHPSNLKGLAETIDPGAQFAAAADAPMGGARGGSAWGDYSNILSGSGDVSSFVSNGLTKAGVGDSFGGSAESVEVTFAVGGTLVASLSSGAMVAGRQGWVEGLIRQGATDTMTRVGVRLQDASNNVYWQRIIDVPTDALRTSPFRFPFRPPVTGGSLVFYVVDTATDLPGAGSTGKARLERIRVYQAREPVQQQPRKEPLELTAGVKLREGTSSSRMGVATLVAGTVTVSTTSVTASSRIMLTPQTGISGAIGFVGVTARTAGTSFTITARDAAGATVTNDTRQVAWVILEPMS
jgi:hypothetical protein